MLLYGSSYWMLTKEQMRRMKMAEMCSHKEVTVYSMVHSKCSEDITQELGITHTTKQ
jgi:hypothetical protein